MSIIDPSVDKLVKAVPNKYLLVVGAAKRGREIMEGAAPTVASKSNKPVTVAMQEIAAGTVRVATPQGGAR